jgi:hypothetical protein
MPLNVDLLARDWILTRRDVGEVQVSVLPVIHFSARPWMQSVSPLAVFCGAAVPGPRINRVPSGPARGRSTAAVSSYSNSEPPTEAT